MRAVSSQRRAGFTLIEVLVVIAIVITLIGLTLAVGTAVGRNARATNTTAAMRAIDLLLNDLIQTRGGIPAPVVEDPRDRDRLLVMADARNLSFVPPEERGGAQIVNSGGLLLLQMRQQGLASESITGLDSKLVEHFTPYRVRDEEGNEVNDPFEPDVVPELPTPLDAWGNPIRYVHPKLDGLLQGSNPADPASLGTTTGVDLTDPDLLGGKDTDYSYNEIRRNGLVGVGDENLLDADGGQAPKQRPYLYSAGPDGKVGRVVEGGEVVADFNADNVYQTKPSFLAPP